MRTTSWTESTNRGETQDEQRTKRLGNSERPTCSSVWRRSWSGTMYPMAENAIPSDAELRDRLTQLQYEVTQNKGTERAFSGIYHDTTDAGTYHCIVCDTALFSSDTKYDAGCGWPSFYAALDKDVVRFEEDRKFGMVRTEALCATCGAHLGHIFPDGPQPTGDRFCMNSASLDLKSATD